MDDSDYKSRTTLDNKTKNIIKHTDLMYTLHSIFKATYIHVGINTQSLSINVRVHTDVCR